MIKFQKETNSLSGSIQIVETCLIKTRNQEATE